MSEPVRLPGGDVIPERRGEDRRREERRREPRRAADRRRSRLSLAQALFWALLGAAVVLYLFFVALDAIDPGEATVVSIVVLVLAVLWLAHAWRSLYAGGFASHGDRERRGF